MNVNTDAASIAAALLVIDHARTEVQALNPGDEVFLYGHVDAAGRPADDSGYVQHTVESVADYSRDMVLVTTNLTAFACSPKHPVYLVGHNREAKPSDLPAMTGTERPSV